MISPLPEGTIVLSFVLSYFGYWLTGNIYVTIAPYLVTFIITIVLIKKLDLVAKFKGQLEKIRGVRKK
jgi:TctA family transporter